MEMFFAHSKQEEPKVNWQSLHEHLINTAILSASFAEKFGAKKLGYTVGLLHDIGKYSLEFQRRLEGCNRPVDHSTAGMKEVFDTYADKKLLAKVMSYVICGHHTGLPNSGSENQEGSLIFRKNKQLNEDYSAFIKEIKMPNLNDTKLPIKPTDDVYFSCFMFIKMLYSCLVDADFLDTEYFMDKKKANQRGRYSPLEELLLLLNDHLEELVSFAEKTTVNQHRQYILECCIRKANNNPGFFSLTVPTGGGKTLSSMAFALNHAIKNKMNRIIYVIPYTSIIEQNAKIFRDIFGEENILEHHSNFQFNEDDENGQDVFKKLRLASENWDVPIIVTTNVQFFESIFSNRSSRSRKLHNLSKSIIILDEAQMLPVKFLKASLLALCELVMHYQTSVVFCTATQPNINNDNLLPRHISIHEIIDKPKILYQKFKRTKVNNLGDINDGHLLSYLRKHKQVLCIVNRREHAKIIFEELRKSGHTYHLSTKMYPLHRQNTLKEIRKRLKNGQPCQVVSTQLIEAGVDVDFPVVYRAISGIDSIAQAAGRCNREGKSACSNVYVFTPVDKHAQPPREIELNVSEAKSVFRHYEDPLSIEAISKYFELLYDIKNTDSKNILNDIKEKAMSLDYPFADIGRTFKIIENNTIPIIIAAKGNIECEKLIDELRFVPVTYPIIRKLQPYIVDVYENEFKNLLESGGVAPVDQDKRFYVLTNLDLFYDENTGIKTSTGELDSLTKKPLIT